MYGNLLESYKSILTRKRMFYPRNFALSPEFLKAFKKEINNLKCQGVKENQILDKLSKALNFHIKES